MEVEECLLIHVHPFGMKQDETSPRSFTEGTEGFLDPIQCLFLLDPFQPSFPPAGASGFLLPRPNSPSCSPL